MVKSASTKYTLWNQTQPTNGWWCEAEGSTVPQVPIKKKNRPCLVSHHVCVEDTLDAILPHLFVLLFCEMVKDLKCHSCPQGTQDFWVWMHSSSTENDWKVASFVKWHLFPTKQIRFKYPESSQSFASNSRGFNVGFWLAANGVELCTVPKIRVIPRHPVWPKKMKKRPRLRCVSPLFKLSFENVPRLFDLFLCIFDYLGISSGIISIVVFYCYTCPVKALQSRFNMF